MEEDILERPLQGDVPTSENTWDGRLAREQILVSSTALS